MPWATYAVPVYVGVTTYAILRYRLMDINVAITRVGIFAVVYTIVLGFPFAVIRFVKPILMPLWSNNWWLTILVLGMAIASAGPFIYMYFQRRATEYLLKEERRTHNLLIKASEGLVNIRELKKLLNTVVSFITKTLHIANAAIYLLDKEEEVYKVESVRYKSKFKGVWLIELKDPLIERLKEKREPLVLEELKIKKQDAPLAEIQSQMQNLSATIIIPSFIEETLLGFLALGERKSNKMYTSSDLAVLSALANHAALAIENAIFYEEQGKTLAQQFQEHRLRSIGRMGSGIGHQINNRFQAISMAAGACLLVGIQDLKKTSLTEEQKNLVEKIENTLKEIVQEVLRGGNIARSLTQFSRTQGEFQAVSFNNIIQGTLNLISCKFDIEEINLSLDYPKDAPDILGDLALLQDTFFNLLDNAHDACLTKQEEMIKKSEINPEHPYTPKVSISAHPRDSFWRIEIKDNGIGMAEDQIDQLFIPFFTTKATSRKGTGLGLSIIKKIIDAHKGSISVASKYGEGTTFIVTLPAAK